MGQLLIGCRCVGCVSRGCGQIISGSSKLLPGMSRRPATIELATSEILPSGAVQAPRNYAGRSNRSHSNRGRWPDSPISYTNYLRRRSPFSIHGCFSSNALGTLYFILNWAEDRATVWEPTRAPTQGPRPETGRRVRPAPFSVSGIGTHAINPRGAWGAGPPVKENRFFRFRQLITTPPRSMGNQLVSCLERSSGNRSPGKQTPRLERFSSNAHRIQGQSQLPSDPDECPFRSAGVCFAL